MNIMGLIRRVCNSFRNSEGIDEDDELDDSGERHEWLDPEFYHNKEPLVDEYSLRKMRRKYDEVAKKY